MKKNIAAILSLLIFCLPAAALAQDKTLQEKLNGEWLVEVMDFLWPDHSHDQGDAEDEAKGTPWAEASISLQDGKGVMIYVPLHSDAAVEFDLKVESEKPDSLVLIGKSNNPEAPEKERITFEYVNDDHVRHVIDDPDGNRMELEFIRKK